MVNLGKSESRRNANMPTRNVNLTDYHDDFVNELVTSGRFSSASEVMRAGLRLLEQQAREEDEKLALLRSMATDAFDALDRGQGIVLGSEGELAEFIGQAGRRAAEEVEHRAVGG
jgi:antitoxin ParD1/3/4